MIELKRDELGREKQLYGALDGAMKFVKGDGIARLIIKTSNIIAGLIIGITQKGMDVNKALKTHSILTIGDGLVSKIPALLIAITSNGIVTHVASDAPSALGQDIGKKYLHNRKRCSLLV
jgi:type III secretion protein V